MRFKPFALSIFVLMISVVAYTGFADAKVEPGQAAPDFTLMDQHGKAVSLSSLKGKTVVLEWINFGCPFVRKHYDSGNMQYLQEKYSGMGVTWLSVCSSAEGKQGYYAGDKLTEQLKDEGWKGAHYLVDEQGTVGKTYGARVTPFMVVIDGEGNIRFAGGIDDKPTASVEDVKGAKNYVVEALDALKSGGEVAVKSSRAYGCGVKYAK